MYLFKKEAGDEFAKVEVDEGKRKVTIIRVKSVYLHDSGIYSVNCKDGDVHTFPATSETSIHPGRG